MKSSPEKTLIFVLSEFDNKELRVLAKKLVADLELTEDHNLLTVASKILNRKLNEEEKFKLDILERNFIRSELKADFDDGYSGEPKSGF